MGANRLKRLLVAAPFAAVATAGLLLTMRMLMDVSLERPDHGKRPVVDRKIAESESMPKLGPEWRADQTGYDIADSDVMPISRSAPFYPACEKGDGQVVLEFTVKANGSVRDVAVISTTSPCFADAARSAPRRWRYRPKIVDGEPVFRNGVRVRLLFKEGNTTATVLIEPTNGLR